MNVIMDTSLVWGVKLTENEVEKIQEVNSELANTYFNRFKYCEDGMEDVEPCIVFGVLLGENYEGGSAEKIDIKVRPEQKEKIMDIVEAAGLTKIDYGYHLVFSLF